MRWPLGDGFGLSADDAGDAVATTAAAAAPSAATARDPLGELIETLPDAYSEWPYVDKESAGPRATDKVAPPRIVVPLAPPPGDLWARIRRGFRIPDLETKLAENRHGNDELGICSD